jgi:AbrB family looped-hinge helix DNA binding protein
METTRLSSKGQIVLPKRIRDAHGWETGARFAVSETADGSILLRRIGVGATAATLSEVAGCLRASRREKPKTIAQMHAAIASEVKRRHARGRY